MGQDLGYCRRVLSGILAFAEAQEPAWTFHDAPSDPRILPTLRAWRPHGVIVHLNDQKLAQGLRTLQVPVVGTTDTLAPAPFPFVDVDNAAVGRMAADYCLQRGYEQLAYYGNAHTRYSQARYEGFVARAQDAGQTVHNFDAPFAPHSPLEADWTQIDQKTRAWLESIPKPIAILASNDIPARALTETCRAVGLRVPQEVAILGVDNDSAVCRMATPQLSSIETPGERIGWTAAETMAQLLAKPQEPAPAEQLLAPSFVIERPSTEARASLHPHLRKALDLIASHASQGMSVKSICQRTGTSRRALERRFREELNQTIYEKIIVTRLTHAQRLLLETDYTISEIAERSGFSNLRQLNRHFTQTLQITPTAFRHRQRLEPTRV